MMRLNRSVLLECPQLDVPWFHEHYCRSVTRGYLTGEGVGGGGRGWEGVGGGGRGREGVGGEGRGWEGVGGRER